ncbi:hypothetical protein L9F63_023142, partial [Diploptera punctata]
HSLHSNTKQLYYTKTRRNSITGGLKSFPTTSQVAKGFLLKKVLAKTGFNCTVHSRYITDGRHVGI